jgi:hypothetical protein
MAGCQNNNQPGGNGLTQKIISAQKDDFILLMKNRI